MRRTARPLIVRPLPPFRLDLTAWALRRRARNLIDRWDGSTYRRALHLDGNIVEVAVRQAGSVVKPRLIVTAVPALGNAHDRRRIRQALDRLLGLNIDLSAWYRLAARDARLRPLARRFRGVKPPRFPTVFEALVNAFACQQLSLEVGLELLNRLAAVARRKIRSGEALYDAFPAPDNLAGLPEGRFRAVGFSAQKARAIRDLSREITSGAFEPALLDVHDDDAVRERLLALQGVGRWTAEYVLLRGLGRLDVFPGDDVGAQKRLALWLRRRRPLDYDGVRRVVQPWQPYAGMVYFHLLLEGLRLRGSLG